MGIQYDEGQGVPQSYAEAAKWYRLAAEQGHAQAQGLLAIKYGLGQGVTQDYVEAHKWINLAAAQSQGYARLRDTIAEEMTPDQIAEAQRLALEWRRAEHSEAIPDSAAVAASSSVREPAP